MKAIKIYFQKVPIEYVFLFFIFKNTIVSCNHDEFEHRI